MVYVLNKQGKPLMPTARHGKVRRLLRDGLAHVARLQPFTIQMDYEVEEYKQAVNLGVNPGSKHVGLSATTEKQELFCAEIELRTDIVKNIASRAELRRGRRFRKTRYRQARFKNRRKPEGWFAPSIRSRIDMHIDAMKMVHDILPISRTIIEIAKFDQQKIDNPEIKEVEYQQGDQLGFRNVREVVLNRDPYKCRHCGGKSKDPKLVVHYLETRLTGGMDPDNLVTLCSTCHEAYHRGELELKIKRAPSKRDMTFTNNIRYEIYNRAVKQFGNVDITYGYITKFIRDANRIDKTKGADAFCISGNAGGQRRITYLKCRRVQRHNRVLHVCNPKKGGKRKSQVASHWIGGSRLQKYDVVRWNGIKCFIYGSSAGRLYLKDIDGKLVTPTATVNTKQVKFVSRNRGSKIMHKLSCYNSND